MHRFTTISALSLVVLLLVVPGLAQHDVITTR